jgi:hypothetical protein
VKFGRLTVLGDSGQRSTNGNKQLLVQCDCGTKKTVDSFSLKSGGTKSCGCMQHKRTHGMTGTAEYRAWLSMWNRCTNPTDIAYSDYGARGIRICDRWKKFENFFADLGLKPEPSYRLDRRKNEGNYTPNNCHWVTAADSNRNTRSTLRVTYLGRKMCLKEAASLAGVAYTTARYRFHKGLPLCV